MDFQNLLTIICLITKKKKKKNHVQPLKFLSLIFNFSSPGTCNLQNRALVEQSLSVMSDSRVLIKSYQGIEITYDPYPCLGALVSHGSYNSPPLKKLSSLKVYGSYLTFGVFVLSYVLSSSLSIFLRVCSSLPCLYNYYCAL